MGSSHSDLAHNPNAHYTPKYDLIQKSFEPHYGEVKFIQEKPSGKKLILKEMVFNNKKTFENEANYFSKLVNLNHPNLVNLVGYNLEDDHGFCSTHFKISVFIENIEHTLQSEFDYRKSTGKAFSDSEITFIADNLISALSYFQGKGYSHGDIRPSNIFIKDQFYKLSDPALNAVKGSNGLALTIAHGAKSFLAPELLEQVPKHRFDITSDPYRADVFSLGVTLLSLATLARGEDLYDYKKGSIDGILLEQRLDYVKHLYSPQTYELIRIMLNLDRNNRPDFIALANRGAAHQPAHHHHQEVAKKSYLVEDHHIFAKPDTHRVEVHHEPTPRTEVQQIQHVDVHHHHHDHHDDLDARIKAALSRSDETVRTMEVKKSSYIPPAYSANVTDYHHTPAPVVEKTVELGTHHRDHEIAKSSLPQSYHAPHTDVYSSYIPNSHITPASTYVPAQTYHHQTPVVEKTVELGTHHRDQEVVKSSAPQDHHVAKPDIYSSYTHNTYTVPTSTYTYTHTPVEIGTHHKDQEVVKSSAPQDHHAAKPDVYSSYTHTSHAIPASTYTYTPATTHEVKSYGHEYTYNPAPVTNTYTTSEKVLKSAAPISTETKHHDTPHIANFNFAQSYATNPTPVYEVHHHTQGSGAADEGAGTDRTAVSINVGDPAFNAILAGTQVPPSGFATKTYEYTSTGTGNQPNTGSNLRFFQNVVSDAHAGRFADQLHGAASSTGQYTHY